MYLAMIVFVGFDVISDRSSSVMSSIVWNPGVSHLRDPPCNKSVLFDFAVQPGSHSPGIGSFGTFACSVSYLSHTFGVSPSYLSSRSTWQICGRLPGCF